MNKLAKKLLAIAVVGMFTGSIAVGVTVSIQKEKTGVSSLLSRNIEALARNEDQDQCGSSTTYYNEALRSEDCDPDPGYQGNSKTKLICKSETDKCCDSNNQTTCSSQW